MASVVALTALLTAAEPVLAAGCYNPNLGVAVALTDQTASKGLQAVQDLSAATPHSSQTGIVHPTQIGMATGDFVGWGTSIGVGTNDPGAISNCPDNPGPRWAIYVDGFTFGQYFCRQAYGSEPATAQNQNAEIKHTTCNGSTQWSFKWNGTVKTCETVDGTGGMPSVGAESIDWDPQTVDVRDRSLTYRVLGGSWTSWYASGSSQCNDFSSGWSYNYTMHSGSDYSFSLGS